MDIAAEEMVLRYAITVKRNGYFEMLKEGLFMRHFYFRLILGLVFVGCAVYSFVTANIPFAVMYVVLGGVFLYSAYTIRKKGDNDRR